MNSIKRLTIFMISIVLLPALSPAATRGGGDQGYGVMLGNPSGVTAKIWLDSEWAIDGLVGVARSEFDIHASLLYHKYGPLDKILRRLKKYGEVPLYVGVGPRLLFEDDKEFGVRLPVGISFLSRYSRWEGFCEFAPVVRLTQDFGFNGDYAIGVRYYFDAVRPRVEKK